MSSHYKLYYLNIRARAEPIRLLLHYTGQEYSAIDFDIEEWGNYEEVMPLKTVPVLEVIQPNGCAIELSHTTAILRYLAKKHDLEANSVEEQAICDAFAEQIQYYASKAREWSWTFIGFHPTEKRDELFEKDIQPIVEELGEIFSEQLKKIGNGYIVGSKITWLDIYQVDFIDKITGHAKPGVFSEYPLIEEHHKRIFSIPSIAQYVKDRPPHPY